MGFLSSISTPISYAQSIGIPDLPFHLNSDNKFTIMKIFIAMITTMRMTI